MRKLEESQFANEFFGSADGILFGRMTYEGFVSYWDTLDLTDESITTTDIEFAKIFRKMTRVVISRTSIMWEPASRGLSAFHTE